MMELVERYHNAIPGSEWESYLVGRGITPESIRGHMLGVVTDDPGDDTMRRFPGCLAFPYYDGRGIPRGFRVRYPDGSWHSNKYDQPKGQAAMPYGVDLIQHAHVVLTEGELDAIVLRQLGFHAIGIPGATAFQEHWALLFRDCDSVTVAYDGDDAGRSGAAKVGRYLSMMGGPTVHDAGIPDGHDVGSLYQADPDELKRLLS